MRYAGAISKENVGMSNDKKGEKPFRRKTKVSSIYVNQIRVSRVLRCSPKGEADGKRVNIPVPCIILRWDDGVTNSLPRDGIRG